MSELLDSAIKDVRQSESAFCRFITANDVGKTGSHQSGFYIPKDSWQLLFDTPGVRGENKENLIGIKWNNTLYTASRAIYYGQGTRNEYRITRFGRGFPLLEPKYSGSLLVFAKMDKTEYSAYVLDTDSDIDGFLAFFSVSPTEQNHLINIENVSSDDKLAEAIESILAKNTAFPSTNEMAALSRIVYDLMHKRDIADSIKNPDKSLVDWIDTEYALFRAFEEREFKAEYSGGFSSCQELIDYSSSILNRRKARAGKSLEHHLSYIFTISQIKYEAQVATEGKKRPDFIFPDGASYHNFLFPVDGLTFLGAKTTCKDRWRQVLNEADRISHKYLFTLQPGISPNQLDEMKSENLSLVVPRRNIETFAASHRDRLLTLEQFIAVVRGKQQKYYTFG